MKPSASCPTDLLPQFLDGHLSAEQSSSIETHLEVCDACRQALHSESGEHAFWSQLSMLSDDQLDRDWSSLSPASGGGTGLAVEVRSGSQNPRCQAAFESIKGLLSPSDDPRCVGRIGSYEILGLVGSGGMGIVLKARDPALDRVVALKILAPHLSVFESSRVRFQREAKAAAAVKHDGIIPIFGVDTHRGTPYFVMPYEMGPSLQKRINDGGKLTVEESLRVATQIADALAAAHQSGLVHRDIKPSNILLAPGTERALLTDFGLAQVASGQQITETGLLAGTPTFMSPEQARGENVDSRSDLFSLGSVLFMMLTGRPPVEGSTTYAVVRKIGGEDMPRVRDVDPSIPVWLDELVARLHATKTSLRIQSAEEAKSLLAECLALVQNPQENRVPVQLLDSVSKRPHKLNAMLAFSLAIAIVAAAIWFASTLELPERSPRPLVESSVSSQQRAEELGMDWDDGLGESVAEIRQRLETLEDHKDWILDFDKPIDKE